MADVSFSSLSPEVIENLTQVLTVWWDPMMYLAYALGIVLFGSGFFTLAKDDKPTAGLMSVIIGALLLNLPAVMNIASYSLFATNAPDGLTYTASGVENAGLITLTIRGTQLFGVIVLVRSLIYFKDYANEQQAQLLYRGTSFFFGSLLCINIVQLLSYMGDWIGGDVSTIVNMLVN